MSVEQEIKELRNKLDELEKQVKEKKITGRYVPAHKENYFSVTSNGAITQEQYYQGNIKDNYRISTGNCFATKEEAEKHKTILINTQKLKDLAERLNNGKEINWNNDCSKYYIYLEKGKLHCNWIIRIQIQGIVYCLDESFLDKAIEEIGEESLIELIKGE